MLVFNNLSLSTALRLERFGTKQALFKKTFSTPKSQTERAAGGFLNCRCRSRRSGRGEAAAGGPRSPTCASPAAGREGMDGGADGEHPFVRELCKQSRRSKQVLLSHPKPAQCNSRASPRASWPFSSLHPHRPPRSPCLAPHLVPEQPLLGRAAERSIPRAAPRCHPAAPEPPPLLPFPSLFRSGRCAPPAGPAPPRPRRGQGQGQGQERGHGRTGQPHLSPARRGSRSEWGVNDFSPRRWVVPCVHSPSGAAAAGPGEPRGEPRAAPGPRPGTAASGGGAFPNNSGKTAVNSTAASSAAWLTEISSAVVRRVTFHGHWTWATEIPFYSQDKWGMSSGAL